MADIWQSLNRVQYVCSCGRLSSLVNQYFCRHCSELKCQECVFTLPEYHFCPHCFESAAGSDLKSKKYQCNHCFKCPSCGSSMSVQQYLKNEEERGQQEKDDTEGKSAKAYYLTCLFCHWTTREVGIPDGPSPLDFKEPNNESNERMKVLLEHYKKMTVADREERERKRRAAKKMTKPWSSILDPVHSSKLSLTSPKSSDVTKIDPNAVSSEASSDVDPFPEDLYTSEVDIDNVTTLEQRLAYPSVQPTNIKDLWPRPFPLTAKRLRRCGKCDHMLCRSEYNPSSVRYKIQQIARLAVPQVKIREIPVPELGKDYTFVLSFVNPTVSVMKISFEALNEGSPVEIGDGKILEVDLPVGEFPISSSEDVDVLDINKDNSSINPEQAKYVSGRGVGEIYIKFTTPCVHAGNSNKLVVVVNYSWTPADKPSDAKMLKVIVCVDLGGFDL